MMEALDVGTLSERKAVMQQVTQEVLAMDRQNSLPIFRVPIICLPWEFFPQVRIGAGTRVWFHRIVDRCRAT